MGITCDIKKLGAAVAADGVVDIFEFLRLFSWRDVPNIEQALLDTRCRFRDIQMTAMQVCSRVILSCVPLSLFRYSPCILLFSLSLPFD